MEGSLRDRLIEILVKGKLIKNEDLERAIETQRKSGGNLGKILVQQGHISQKDLMVVVSRQLNIPPINISKYKIDKSLTQLIPDRVARQYSVIPISKLGNVLTIAMSDPLNIFAIDEIKMLTKYQIEPIIATEDDIKEAIGKYYGSHSEEITKILEETAQTPEADLPDESARRGRRC